MQELLNALRELGLPEQSLSKAELLLKAYLAHEREKWGVYRAAIRFEIEKGRRERGKLIREKAKLKREVLKRIDTWHKVRCPMCGTEFKVNSAGRRWDEVHAGTRYYSDHNNSSRTTAIKRRGWLPW